MWDGKCTLGRRVGNGSPRQRNGPMAHSDRRSFSRIKKGTCGPLVFLGWCQTNNGSNCFHFFSPLFWQFWGAHCKSVKSPPGKTTNRRTGIVDRRRRKWICPIFVPSITPSVCMCAQKNKTFHIFVPFLRQKPSQARERPKMRFCWERQRNSDLSFFIFLSPPFSGINVRNLVFASSPSYVTN